MRPTATGEFPLGEERYTALLREKELLGFDARELREVGDILGGLLADLEAVPEWQAGANLRYHLITALHGIRAQLLHVGNDPAAGSAADDLANLPFIASDAIDRAVQDAVEGGLTCEDVP